MNIQGKQGYVYTCKSINVIHYINKLKDKNQMMASGPITSWPINGETMETMTDFILGGSKITADGDCSHDIKRCLFLGRKAMTNIAY